MGSNSIDEAFYGLFFEWPVRILRVIWVFDLLVGPDKFQEFFSRSQ